MTLPKDDDDPPDSFDGLTHRQRDYWNSVESNEEIQKDLDENPPRRGRARKYGDDRVVDTRMSQTEVALRVARHLSESPLLDGTVYVHVGGAEVNRRDDDSDFPVRSYLSRWGFSKDRGRAGVKPEWIGFYTGRRSKRQLLINFDKRDGHIRASFATGQRLIVHCTGGNLGNTRSPAEHHDLHRAVGRAICWAGARPDDVIAVCTPRSERFRQMTAARRKSVGVKRAGLLFLHVDRGGGMIGLAGEAD